jgi:hypothetical protein
MLVIILIIITTTPTYCRGWRRSGRAARGCAPRSATAPPPVAPRPPETTRSSPTGPKGNNNNTTRRQQGIILSQRSSTGPGHQNTNNTPTSAMRFQPIKRTPTGSSAWKDCPRVPSSTSSSSSSWTHLGAEATRTAHAMEVRVGALCRVRQHSAFVRSLNFDIASGRTHPDNNSLSPDPLPMTSAPPPPPPSSSSSS